MCYMLAWQNAVYWSLSFEGFCRSSKQHAVLSISDAALVKECQDILDKSAATSAAPHSISHPLMETESSDSSNQSADHRQEMTCPEADASMQPAAADIMDMETQLLPAEPHPMSNAMHTLHSVPAAGRADDQAEKDSQETQSFSLLSTAGSKTQASNPPLPRLDSNGNSRNVLSTAFSLPKTDSATWQQQQRMTAAPTDVEPPGNMPAVMEASHCDAAALSPAPAPHKKASNMDSLLEAMLAGDM